MGPDNMLYAGGEFLGAGTVNVNNLATWDGSAWGRIAPYLNGTVRALAAAPDGTLYVGGDFTQAGTLATSHVAKWSGGGWQALGTGTNGPVTALEVTSDGTLYVAGDFTQAGGLATGGLAVWNGAGWSPFNNQSPSGLRDMARHDDTVYAVSDTALYVRQGGTSQTFPFDGASITVLAVAPDGVLYAGGYVEGTSTSTTRHIARWNGVTWQPFSTPLGPDAQIDVKALALVANAELYVGGQLTRAGSTAASYIAHWGAVPITGLTIIGDGAFVVGQQKGLSATITTGNNVHYTWDFGDGSAPAYGAAQSHSYGDAGSYTAVVTASNHLGTQVATTTVTVTNAAPVASAGLDQTVGPATLVALDGGPSSDPDGHTPLSYAWTQLAGPAVSLSDPASAGPTFSAPRIGGVLVFRLVVTDAYGLMSDPDEVVVRAAPVSRIWLPLIASGEATS